MVKHSREGDDLRETQGIRGRPLADGLAVDTLRCGHERIGRLNALNEQISGTEQDVDVARYPLLRGQQERLDVTANGVQQLPLVYEVAVGLRHELLDPLLPTRQHQLFQLAMRREERLGGGSFERDPTLRTDNGVAQV